ncbi:MAG: stalk domain-containing protein [Monoglobus pectinilyticus]
MNFNKALETIGYSAFQNCYSLTEVTIPENVTSIGSEIFKNCTSLKKVNLNNALKEIGSAAFINCYYLTEITIPKGVESIKTKTLKNCTYLKNVNLSEGLKYIGNEAFTKCASLSDIELPESIESVSSTIFLNCDRIGNMYDHFAALKNIERKMILTIDNDTAKVGNIDVYLGAAPQIVNNRTMLPARPVADFIGAKTDWSELDETVTIHSNNNNIKLKLGSNIAYVNNKAQTLDSPPYLYKDRTFVPLRFLVENLDAKITWDEESQTVTIE